MVLGIDLRCLPTDGSAGSGVAHAAREITRALLADGRASVISYVPRGALFDDPIVELDGTRRSDLVRGLKKRACDMLFVPSGAVSPGLPVRAVPWVHDVDIFDHPDWFPQSWMKRMFTTSFFLRGIRRAPHVFAVSTYTEKALLRLAPNVSITVTGEGGDPVLAGMAKSQHSARPFVLVLGTVEPRKNIELVCDIWPEVSARAPGVDLVIAGRDGWKTGPIKAAMDRCSLIRRTDVSDDVRRELLLSASLVLVPSWSEGFGLVALEAVQARTPVLASNRGALPEVLGQGEWLLDPADRHAWQDKTVQLLMNSMTRQRVINGQSAVKTRWSWERVARTILDQFPNIK